jgi:hypothetical protein
MRSAALVLAGFIILSFCSFAGYAADQTPQATVSPAPAAAPATTAPAAQAAPAPTPPKTIGNMTVDELRAALGFSMYFQGGYVYNTRDPRSQENGLRLFDHSANSFSLDLAQIRFQKDADMGGFGYTFRLSFGETAEFIHSRGLGPQYNNLTPGSSDFTNTTPFDLTQANITYNAPLGKGLQFTFGKFATPIGAEVIEAADNFNYSRSFLFNYAIPFTHTGLKTYYSFCDAFNAAFYLVNGWDNTSDNNNGKTVGLSLGVTPVKPVSLAFNFMYGPEQDNNSSNERFLFDWVATITATKNLTFVLNTDYATEQGVLTALGSRDVKWYGIAGYAKYSFNDWFAIALRGEWFNDPDGARTTFTDTGLPNGIGQTLKEGTFTTEFKIAKNLILRPEYRHDWSNKDTFGSVSAVPTALPSGHDKTQDTLSVGVMYLF